MCKHRPRGGLSVLASQTSETTVLALSREVGSDMSQDPPNVSTSVILLWKPGGVNCAGWLPGHSHCSCQVLLTNTDISVQQAVP